MRTNVPHGDGRAKAVAKGENVLTWCAGSNRDPDVFDSSYLFLVDRSSNPQQSFGNTVLRISYDVRERIVLDSPECSSGPVRFNGQTESPTIPLC